MEELKQKYGIDDKAIFEIADSLEPNANASEIPPVGNGRTALPPTSEALPASLASAMRGDISIAEAIILMDYMDRKDERRERRYGTTQPSQDTSNIKGIIDEMREERRSHQEQIEKLILGKRADDAEDRAKRAEEDLKKNEETDRQRQIVEGAVQGAVSNIERQFGSQLNTLTQKISQLPANQQTSLMDELSTDFGTSLKEEFKTMILNRLKPPETPITKTDETGKPSIDWGGVLDKGFKLADKYIETQGKTPPKLAVKEIPTETVPLSEGSPEITGEPPQEIITPAVTLSPIPPQDIEGIGPERAKKLSELGITDARQLSKVSPSYLNEQLGVGKEKAIDIIKQAKELIEKT